MKKITSILLVLFLALTLIGCVEENGNNNQPPDNNDDNGNNNGEDPLLIDKIPPILTIAKSEMHIVIKQGEDYDLMKGISGFDNLELDITDKVIIVEGDYDNNVPGTYHIVYFLTDTAGNSASPIERVIEVLDTSIFVAPPIYNDVISGELPKPQPPAYFGGAWYHKVVSSKDKWSGIEGTFTLPHVKITRYRDNEYDSSLDVDPNGVNLDNPSVYMGGHATNESDVGLSFSKGLVNIENNTLSRGSIVFRPFWRYITSNENEKDLGGYDLANGRRYAVSNAGNPNNMIANWHYEDTEYYYLPGDKLRMLIVSPEPNKLQMQIEVIEKSKDPVSVKMREDYGWKDPENFKSPIFASPGHGIGANAEYKRVNAIDQTANEGGTAIDTNTIISNAIWHEVYLYRNIEGTMYRVPFTTERSSYLSARDESKFTVSYDGVDKSKGGEVVTIHPGYSN